MADEIKIKIPDIGGATDVSVIELLVKPGDEISENASLITLESDKASMEIPSPQAGKIKDLLVKVGDKVSEGDTILTLISNTASSKTNLPAEENPSSPNANSSSSQKEKDSSPSRERNFSQSKAEDSSTLVREENASSSMRKNFSSSPQEEDRPPPDFMRKNAGSGGADTIFAGPAVRRLARELGVNLAQVPGTGRKSRISKDDLQLYVRNTLGEKNAAGFSLPQTAAVDFSKFGETELKPLNKIKRLTGVNLHRSWITVPHVTQFEEADITELEAFRKAEAENAPKEYKLTLLAFVTKIVAKALAVYPQFNASLDPTGENLIYKRYFHIGIAVETDNGLVVPVIKNVDQLSVNNIAKEMARLSVKAREKGLMPGEMNGGCFTISSLGGIGGTFFTPIVNSPEVAILGLSRAAIKAVYKKGSFIPRLILPLSLSYDHRVIDGAEAARFARFIAVSLADIRRILL